MPTYEYRCDACDHEFEEFQWIKEEPIKICPACGKRKVRRLIGAGGAVVFKGSGFYQTDYRSESYKKGAASDSKSSDASSSGKSSDTKSPEKKSPEKKSSAGQACKKGA